MTRTSIVVSSVATIGLAAFLAIATGGSAELSLRSKVNANAKMNVASDRAPAHRLAVQVDVNDAATMNLVLNNVSNAAQYYNDLGQKIEIEVVAFGPGLHMLRDDTSPVKGRIKSMSEAMPEVTFSACGNTHENMTKAEAKEFPLISQAKSPGRAWCA